MNNPKDITFYLRGGNVAGFDTQVTAEAHTQRGRWFLGDNSRWLDGMREYAEFLKLAAQCNVTYSIDG